MFRDDVVSNGLYSKAMVANHSGDMAMPCYTIHSLCGFDEMDYICWTMRSSMAVHLFDTKQIIILSWSVFVWDMRNP